MLVCARGFAAEVRVCENEEERGKKGEGETIGTTERVLVKVSE